MDTDREHIKRLLRDYSAGSISQSDFARLQDYLNSSDDSELDALLAELFEEMEVDLNFNLSSDGLYQSIIHHANFHTSKHRSMKKVAWAVGAAAALVLILFKLFIFQRDSVPPQHPLMANVEKQPLNEPFSADRNTATLRLSDGTLINLDDAKNGFITQENQVKISLKGTKLQYMEDKSSRGQMEASGMNTISTGSGKQFQVELPDGTLMWLNAASSLSYPVHFDAESRVVEITGEAYFEVEKAQDWPFIVKTTTQEISVLGTHFNISAYPDDQFFKTTLVEGSLRVKARDAVDLSASSTGEATGKSLLLKPGEQAITYKGKDRLNLRHVDTQEVISWKNNLFVFHNEEVSEGMKKVMRWYDVEMVYQDGMEGKRIGGTIPRFEKIEQLMDALQATGLLHYKMEGGKVMIMK